jgi:hypothetical protein
MTDWLTDWLTDSQSQRDFDFDFDFGKFRANWNQVYRRIEEAGLWGFEVWLEDFIRV